MTRQEARSFTKESSVTDCIILCGGFGTRLQKTVPNLPKALAPINNQPFLDLLLKQLGAFDGLSRVILATGYRAEQIQEHCQKHLSSLPIEFSFESKPLGTGGGIKKALSVSSSESVLIMNGDSYCDFSFESFYQFHRDKEADITLLCPHVKNSNRYGQIKVDSETSEIFSFAEKQEQNSSGRINGGVYLIRKNLLINGGYPESFSLEKMVFPQYIRRKMYAYLHEGVFVDIGTHRSFLEAQHLLKHITIK